MTIPMRILTALATGGQQRCTTIGWGYQGPHETYKPGDVALQNYLDALIAHGLAGESDGYVGVTAAGWVVAHKLTPSRKRILLALGELGAKRLSDLVQELYDGRNSCRGALHRQLMFLEDAQLVVYSLGLFAATQAGEYVIRCMHSLPEILPDALCQQAASCQWPAPSLLASSIACGLRQGCYNAGLAIRQVCAMPEGGVALWLRDTPAHVVICSYNGGIVAVRNTTPKGDVLHVGRAYHPGQLFRYLHLAVSTQDRELGSSRDG